MCRREFVGVTTFERTMHAQVVDLEVTEGQLREIARGYVRELFGDEDPDEVEAYVRDLMEPAEGRPVGVVLERWGYELRDIRDNTLDVDDAVEGG